MTTFRIPVWQFVRIMVKLEPRRGRKPSGVYAHWRAAWQEVDRELARLGASDAEAFSALMMQHQITLSARNYKDLAEVSEALQQIIRTMRQELVAPGTGLRRKKDLQYEMDELRSLHTKLSGGAKKLKPPRSDAANRKVPRRSRQRR